MFYILKFFGGGKLLLCSLLLWINVVSFSFSSFSFLMIKPSVPSIYFFCHCWNEEWLQIGVHYTDYATKKYITPHHTGPHAMPSCQSVHRLNCNNWFMLKTHFHIIIELSFWQVVHFILAMQSMSDQFDRRVKLFNPLIFLLSIYFFQKKKQHNTIRWYSFSIIDVHISNIIWQMKRIY